MAITILPWHLPFWYRDLTLFVDPATRSAGASLSGVEQVVVSGADKWRASVDFSTIPPQHLLAWRGFLARLRGRAQAFELPIVDLQARYCQQDDLPAWVTRGTPYADGAYHAPGGEGYYARDEESDIVAPALAGSAQISIDLSSWGEILQSGSYFMLDSYLHIADYVDHDPDTNIASIDISPPLRADVGAATIFSPQAYLVCRLDNDASGVAVAEYTSYAAPSFSVIEVLER